MRYFNGKMRQSNKKCKKKCQIHSFFVELLGEIEKEKFTEMYTYFPINIYTKGVKEAEEWYTPVNLLI